MGSRLKVVCMIAHERIVDLLEQVQDISKTLDNFEAEQHLHIAFAALCNAKHCLTEPARPKIKYAGSEYRLPVEV